MLVQVRGLNVPDGDYGSAVGEESGGGQEEAVKQDDGAVTGVIGLRYVDARDVLQGLHDMLEAYRELPDGGTISVKRGRSLIAVGSWGG